MLEAIKNSTTELRFTGNWFIDAGILGFVNLMEEVYGWDLEKIQEMIIKEPEKVYYGFFPIAFVYYNNKLTNKESKKPRCEELNNILGNLSSKNNQEIFDKAWKFIIKNYFDSTKGRVNLRSKGLFFYFQNFLFFQPSWKEKKQKEGFQEILGLMELKSEVLKNIDRTVNKFLPSADEFSNLPYTKSFIEISALKQILPNSNFIFILTFPFAFIPIRSEKDNMFFYSPNIDLTYKVNKKLKTYIKEMEEKRPYDSIFRITWNAVLDSVIETESIWSIENMYIITYTLGKKQKIFNVMYVGIPKLQASLLVDDVIRENLNKNIQFRSKNFKGNGYCWLIEEFIKGKPLYPIILSHANLVLNEGVSLKKDISLYSLIVEAKILEFKTKNKKNNLFSADYFDNYKFLINEIKDEVRFTSFRASHINQISEDINIKKRVARELFGALKAENKNIFLNILLKNLNEASNKYSYNNLNNWIYDKIIETDVSWKMYSLILIMYLLYEEV